MARMARVVVPCYPHHVTQRGNRRQKTFFCNEDYHYYVELMAEFTCVSGTQVWAYCLMPNHVHFVMVPSRESGLRESLGEAHRRYTRFVNFRKGWRGHLWQERFHSFPMDEKYLLSTVRYVERNPVSARLCDKPVDWRWSSARAHMEGKDDGLVIVKPMLERITNWSDYLRDEDDDPSEIARLREHTQTGRPLGGADFIEKLEIVTGRVLARQKPGRKQKENTK